MDPPDACKESEVRVAVSDAEARELGFGETLNLFDRSFSASLAWTVVEWPELPPAPPASGYEETSVVAVETRISSIDHLVPELEGCADRLSVLLDISLSTDDGAISIAGKIPAYAGKNLENTVFGRLDLATASGSLRVAPPDSSQPTVGFLSVQLKFWPDTVRGEIYVELVEWNPETGDVLWRHRPLDGRFPNDACHYSQLPRLADEPSPVLSGKSVTELRNELAALLETQQPVLGTWLDGSETTVTAELGEPSLICENVTWVDYEIPLGLTTGDGRVQLEEQAHGVAVVDSAGALSEAGFSIFNEAVIPTESFAETSGISDVDLTGFIGARWQVSVQLLDPTNPHGELVIEGVDPENRITDPVEQLTWQLE
jgi:hypothetical protein